MSCVRKVRLTYVRIMRMVTPTGTKPAGKEMTFDLISDALREDLAKITEGWSPKTYIIDRAVAIREAVAADDYVEAEHLAAEIERLQIADDQRLRIEQHRAPEGREIWALSAERWAEYLIHAWKRNRFFYPAEGCASETALGEAHRVFFVKPWSGSKFIHATDIARVSEPLKTAA